MHLAPVVNILQVFEIGGQELKAQVSRKYEWGCDALSFVSLLITLFVSVPCRKRGTWCRPMFFLNHFLYCLFRCLKFNKVTHYCHLSLANLHKKIQTTTTFAQKNAKATENSILQKMLFQNFRGSLKQVVSGPRTGCSEGAHKLCGGPEQGVRMGRTECACALNGVCLCAERGVRRGRMNSADARHGGCGASALDS